MESQPISNEKPEIDPRRKDGQGLDFWADAFLKQGIISQEERDEFVAKK